MPNRNRGPEHNRWKGGRSVASNGYVLVRVGIGHHLADVRGYAYEHRVVAEGKLGRRLQPDEQVHHRDHNKQNNDPSNLEVVTAEEHRFEHRTVESERRRPNEPNPRVSCACGCGDRFRKFDANGRPRSFTTGHNPHEAPLLGAILRELRSGRRATRDLIASCGTTAAATKGALTKLVQAGRISRVGRGLYELPEAT